MTLLKPSATITALVGVSVLLAFQGLAWTTQGGPLFDGAAFYPTLAVFLLAIIAHLAALVREHYDRSALALETAMFEKIDAAERAILARLDDLETSGIMTLLDSSLPHPRPSPQPRTRHLRSM